MRPKKWRDEACAFKWTLQTKCAESPFETWTVRSATCKGTHQLQRGLLDHLPEAQVRMCVTQMLHQFGDYFGVRFRFELVAFFGLRRGERAISSVCCLSDQNGSQATQPSRSATWLQTHQELLDVLVVRDDSVVHHDELLLGVAALWMRVQLGRCAVCRPSGVRDADVVGDRLV